MTRSARCCSTSSPTATTRCPAAARSPSSATPGPDSAQITVTDTGIGHGRGDPRRHLHPFFTKKACGIGLGPGRDQTDRRSPPRHDHGAEHAFGGQLVHHDRAHRGGAGRRAGMSGSAVLVVDDEPGMRDTLVAILEQNGYQVSSAPDGESAFSAVQQTDFAVVVMDIRMPGRDGVSVLEDDGGPAAPGHSDDGLRPGSTLAGCGKRQRLRRAAQAVRDPQDAGAGRRRLPGRQMTAAPAPARRPRLNGWHGRRLCRRRRSRHAADRRRHPRDCRDLRGGVRLRGGRARATRPGPAGPGRGRSAAPRYDRDRPGHQPEGRTIPIWR